MGVLMSRSADGNLRHVTDMARLAALYVHMPAG